MSGFANRLCQPSQLVSDRPSDRQERAKPLVYFYPRVVGQEKPIPKQARPLRPNLTTLIQQAQLQLPHSHSHLRIICIRSLDFLLDRQNRPLFFLCEKKTVVHPEPLALHSLRGATHTLAFSFRSPALFSLSSLAQPAGDLVPFLPVRVSNITIQSFTVENYHLRRLF